MIVSPCETGILDHPCGVGNRLVLELSAVAVDNTVLEHLTKPLLLLPLLMLFVLVEVGWNADPSIKFLIIGQFFSFLGDVALMLDGDLWFALGIAMFLITHIFYIIGFFKLGARQGLRDRRWVLFAYPLFGWLPTRRSGLDLARCEFLSSFTARSWSRWQCVR